MVDKLDKINYEDVRGFLPPEAQRYLDSVTSDDYRSFALNKFMRLLYTNEELRTHYNQLRSLGYTVKQSRRLRYLSPARLHRILNREIVVLFAKDAAGKETDRYLRTINASDNPRLNNFHNIDKGYIKANGDGSSIG